MAIIVSKSRRGLFNLDEWETFAGKDGNGPVDTRVFLRCRNPSCWRIWSLARNTYAEINIDTHPMQCDECGKFNITASWCDLKDRPKTYIGGANPPYSEYVAYSAAWTRIQTARNHQPKPIEPNPADLDLIMHEIHFNSTYMKDHPELQDGHVQELWHEYIEKFPGAGFDDATKRPRWNNEFYRAILFMVIQTEVIIPDPVV